LFSFFFPIIAFDPRRRQYFVLRGDTLQWFDRHGSTKLKDCLRIAEGLRVDVIGKKDDDAFYFSVIRPGQKSLNLRTFSPVDGVEWVRAVAAQKATVSPASFLATVGGALGDSHDLASSSSSATTAAAAPPLRVTQSERVHAAPAAAAAAAGSPVRKNETMPTRVGADAPIKSVTLGADGSDDSSTNEDRGTTATAATATTASATTSISTSATAAATAQPQHYLHVPSSAVPKLPLDSIPTAAVTATAATPATPTAVETPKRAPASTVSVPVDFDCHTSKPWFRPDLTRVGAVEFLERKAVGCFVIRLSSQNGCLCISHVEQNASGATFVGHGIIHQWRGPPPARYGWSIEQVQATYPTLELLLRSLPLIWEADSAYGNPAATASTTAVAATTAAAAAAATKTTTNNRSSAVQCEQLARSSPWPAARRGHSLVAIGGGSALLLGGAGPAGRALAENERVWLATVRGSSCTWERWGATGALLPALSDFGAVGLASSALAAAVVVENLYLFGGRHADGRVSGDLVCVSTSSKQAWVVLPGGNGGASPAARHSHTFVMITAHTALLLGGQDAHGQLCKDAWLFDTQTRAWTELSLPFKPTPRFGQAAVTQHGTVAVLCGFGGATQQAPKADIWALANGQWRLVCGAAPFGERTGAAAAVVVFADDSAPAAAAAAVIDDDDDPLAALTAMAEAASLRGVAAPVERSVCLLIGGLGRAEYLDDTDDGADRRVWLTEQSSGPADEWKSFDVDAALERRQGAAVACVRSGCALLFGGGVDAEHVVDDAYYVRLEAPRPK
jgi:hypothetical protein